MLPTRAMTQARKLGRDLKTGKLLLRTPLNSYKLQNQNKGPIRSIRKRTQEKANKKHINI